MDGDRSGAHTHASDFEIEDGRVSLKDAALDRKRPAAFLYCGVCACCVGFYCVVGYLVGHFLIAPRLSELHINRSDACFDSPHATALANKVAEQTKERWPPCYAHELIANITSYNAAHVDRFVSFPARRLEGHEHLNLTAWWLPSGQARDASATPLRERVVVLHGTASNANTYTNIVATSMLRSLGFDVLSPNLRDRCGSGTTWYQTVGYGYDFPYDLLGAWDYAVEDPDGLLGGRLPPAKVAILGFSMGAFTAATAFGLEPRIPGAFLDSITLSAYSATFRSVYMQVHPLVAYFFLPIKWTPAWLAATRAALVDLDFNTPMKTLPTGPDMKRPVGLTHNEPDITTPPSDSEFLMREIEHGSLSAKYKVTEKFFTNVQCGSKTHVVQLVAYPEVYRQKLCAFFTGVFRIEDNRCGGNLPWGITASKIVE